MSSTGAERASTSATNRSHNQGRQDRTYTPAQMAAVSRVRKCKHSDYYAILDIEAPSSDSEVRKAYRKLALIMHPDKNGAPGADEAFKMVSKAFQILSDADKKRIYDQTGSDPDSRGGGGGGGFSSTSARAASGFGGGSPFGADISPDDLFNMFFGGSGFGAGGAGGQFGGFGGPGIRVHTFGGGSSPFSAFQQGAGARTARPSTARGTRQQPQEPFSVRQLFELLPLVLLFFVPLLFSLFGDSSSSTGLGRTRYEFKPVPPYTLERTTPLHHIPFYIKPEDATRLSDRGLRNVGREAENSYIQILKNRCYNEYEHKQQKISDSRGWFFVDTDAYNEAIKIPLPSCDRLDTMRVDYK